MFAQRSFFENLVGIVVGGLLLLSNIALGHHSISPFDRESIQELEGTVSSVQWINPHIRLTIRVGDEEWEVEGDSPNAAERQGLTRESMQVGDEVRLAGWPSTLGRREVFLTNILIDGAETVVMDLNLPLVFTQSEEASFVDPAEADPERGIFRVWSSSGELYQLRSPYVLTSAAEAARVNWDPYTDQLSLRCVAPGMPNAILNPYPIEIIDRGDQILIRIEEWEAVRTVDMVLETIPEGVSDSLLGYSVGRWEDDRTLVVETGRVDFPYLDDAGTPMSNDVRMIERFSLSQDGNDLAYEISVTDSENLVEPVVWVAAWTWIPGTIIRPYECEVD
jgi:hypothetical protein